MNMAQDTTTLASEVYGIVRRRIMRGDLPPGEPISRRTVAAEVRTSLLPVAEALHRLEFEGLLESRPRAGTRVRIPSRDDVKGHYVVREALEVQAAARVAALASERDLEKLRAMAERVDSLRHQPDRFLYATTHHAFHRRIAECSRCTPLSEALEQTHAFAALWFSQVQQPPPDDSATLHQELVDALASGDPVKAGDAMREHIAVGFDRSMEVLEPYFQLRVASGRTFQRSRRRRARSASTTPA
jgi:DNA-binding GntR family transcriptional regulator